MTPAKEIPGLTNREPRKFFLGRLSSNLRVSIDETQWMAHGPRDRSVIEPDAWAFDVPWE